MRQHHGQDDGDPRSDVRSSLPNGHHDGDDRAGTSQQRRPKRNERDIDAFVPRIRCRGIGAHEEFHGDQEQQDAAGQLQCLHRNAQEAQDLSAEDRECQDDTEGHGGRLDRCPPLLGLGITRRESQEDRHRADGVHDDRQRREGGGEEGDVEEAHGCTTSMLPCAMTSAMMSGSVVFSPMRLGLPVPW